MTKRLLLVDDEETILFAFRNYFTRCGFEVECARELEEAEALASYVAFDLVIADLCLTAPGSREGLELVRYVRRHCPGARLIVVTGYDADGVEVEVMRRGADAFVAKPRPLAEIAKIAAALMGEAA
jgi:ActR/RegA family two-component response regulator